VKNKITLAVILIILSLLFIDSEIFAQCAMCRGIAETSIQEGSKNALGLNAGILYLFLTPYLLVGIIGFVLYKNYKKSRLAAE